MSVQSQRQRRPVGSLVEFAIVAPLTFLLLLGLVIGGLGVFRYQEVASLAREGARSAAVHGGQYAKDNAQAIAGGTFPSVDEAYLRDKVVRARAVSLDTSQLQVQVWLNTNTGTFDWDATQSNKNNNRSPTSTFVRNSKVTAKMNTVKVTVSYSWVPELYLVGPITLTSTSEMPMAY